MLSLKFLRRLSLLALTGFAAQAHAGSGDFFKAAIFDDVPSMQKLLAQGADPNQLDDSRGETGMIMALHEGSSKVFTLLLQQPGINIEAGAANGSTALMMASFMHNQPAVLALLDKGAQVNRPGFAALHFAAAAGDDAIVRILLDHHAYIDAESPNKVTPLMIAAREGQQSTVKLLLEAGADASLKTGDGNTASDLALERDKPYIARDIAAFLKAKAAAKP
ncbi:MAG TPA: ankyrin repeat domain-containing protein [Janthinobacterium sp.]|nr:ankyrin repeat domain-containing protein [Janthinobacterium sp.]